MLGWPVQFYRHASYVKGQFDQLVADLVKDLQAEGYRVSGAFLLSRLISYEGKRRSFLEVHQQRDLLELQRMIVG